MPTEWVSQLVLARWQLKRPMYDFKNSFSLAFIYIHIKKYIFSRDMFCLPHFWAKIHGVLSKKTRILKTVQYLAEKGIYNNFWKFSKIKKGTFREGLVPSTSFTLQNGIQSWNFQIGGHFLSPKNTDLGGLCIFTRQL